MIFFDKSTFKIMFVKTIIIYGTIWYFIPTYNNYKKTKQLGIRQFDHTVGWVGGNPHI